MQIERFDEYKLVFATSEKPVDTTIARTKAYQDQLSHVLHAVDTEWRQGLVNGVGFTSFEKDGEYHHCIAIKIKGRDVAETIASYFPDQDLLDENGEKVVPAPQRAADAVVPRFVHLRDAASYQDWTHEQTKALWQVIDPEMDALSAQGMNAVGAGVFSINGTLQFGLLLRSTAAGAQAVADLFPKQAKVVEIEQMGEKMLTNPPATPSLHDITDEDMEWAIAKVAERNPLIQRVTDAIRASTGEELAARAEKAAQEREEILRSSLKKRAEEGWVRREESAKDAPPKRER